jgi:GDP-D-mannose dehydratase
MLRILRQARLRGVTDVASEYRDYVLGTGVLHAVWQLINAAFALANFELTWHMDPQNALNSHALFTSTGELAVVVDPQFVRPADPIAIAANPTRVRCDLGWLPTLGVDVFLNEMLSAASANWTAAAER